MYRVAGVFLFWSLFVGANFGLHAPTFAYAAVNVRCVLALDYLDAKNPQDLRNEVLAAQKRFWKQGLMPDTAGRFRRGLRYLREKLINQFMVWNLNLEPSIYIDEGTFETTMVYATGSAVKPEFIERARAQVQSWLVEYESFEPKINALVSEAFTLKYQINWFNAHLPKITDYPAVIEIEDFYKTKLYFRDATEARTHVKRLKERLRILTGSFLHKGEITKKLYDHSVRYRRLQIVRNQVQDQLITARDRLSVQHAKELEVFLVRVENALARPELHPWPRLMQRTRWIEFRHEYLDLFRTVKQQEIIRKGLELHGALTDADRKKLGLLDAGRYVNLFRATPVGALIGTAVLGGGISWTAAVSYFQSESARIHECAVASTDQAFDSCVVELVKREFPAEYVSYMEHHSESRLDDESSPQHERFEQMMDEVYRERREVLEERAREHEFMSPALDRARGR